MCGLCCGPGVFTSKCVGENNSECAVVVDCMKFAGLGELLRSGIATLKSRYILSMGGIVIIYTVQHKL